MFAPQPPPTGGISIGSGTSRKVRGKSKSAQGGANATQAPPAPARAGVAPGLTALGDAGDASDAEPSAPDGNTDVMLTTRHYTLEESGA